MGLRLREWKKYFALQGPDMGMYRRKEMYRYLDAW